MPDLTGSLAPQHGAVEPYPILRATGFPSYDFLCSLLGLGRGFRQDVVNRLSLTGGERLLDLGCGSGTLLAEARRCFPDLTAAGIDPDPILLKVAKQRLKSQEKKVKLYLNRAEALPFPDESFDVVVSTLAFHHLPTPAKRAALREAFRVLSWGGRLLVVDFGREQSFLVRLWQSLFERGEFLGDHVDGRVPGFIADANFSNVRCLHRRWPSLEYHAGEKLGP